MEPYSERFSLSLSVCLSVCLHQVCHRHTLLKRFCFIGSCFRQCRSHLTFRNIYFFSFYLYICLGLFLVSSTFRTLVYCSFKVRWVYLLQPHRRDDDDVYCLSVYRWNVYVYDAIWYDKWMICTGKQAGKFNLTHKQKKLKRFKRTWNERNQTNTAM